MKKILSTIKLKIFDKFFYRTRIINFGDFIIILINFKNFYPKMAYLDPGNLSGDI